MSHTPTVSFARVLVAHVHKDQAPALVADAIGEAAHAYALNGGAKNLIMSVITACQTTSTGKPRTPASGTVPALVLGAMGWILSEAEGAGARPKIAPDHDTRAARAITFAADIKARYTVARDEADEARKQKREQAKALKGEPVTTIDTTEGKDTQEGNAPDNVKALAPVAVVDKVADMLASLNDDQIADLINAHGKAVSRLVNIAGAVAAVADVMANATKAPARARGRNPQKEAA